MNLRTFFWYLFVMSGSTYLIRAIPFALFTKKIENRFIKSFLYFIPYAVLAAMTVPAVFYATDSVLSAALGVLVAVVVALLGRSLTVVSVCACAAVFVAELFL